MTDYSLWEVIINGDSVISRIAIDGVAQPVTVLTADLPSEWKTQTLIWRNKANLEEHSLDDLFNSLKIYETEVRHSSSLSNQTQNLAFVSSSNTDSTTDSEEIWVIIELQLWVLICLKWSVITAIERDISPGRSPKDTRRTSGAEPHRRTTPVKTSTSNALVSQCDGIGNYDWSYQAEEEPANFALMAIPSLSSFDNEAALESIESRLVVYKQNESIFQENIIELKNKVEARDNFILTLKQKLKQAETERDDLKLRFKNFQSSKSLTELIATQTNNEHSLGYLSSEDNYESVSLTSPSNRFSPSGGYHVSPAKPAQVMSHTTESMAPIIEDWVSNSEDESEPNDP
nr:ribonuclease H-like domain-containing protein [Tanacetum cinerariifolium]